MRRVRFTEEFKIEAVKQISERLYPVSEVSSRHDADHDKLFLALAILAGEYHLDCLILASLLSILI